MQVCKPNVHALPERETQSSPVRESFQRIDQNQPSAGPEDPFRESENACHEHPQVGHRHTFTKGWVGDQQCEILGAQCFWTFAEIAGF